MRRKENMTYEERIEEQIEGITAALERGISVIKIGHAVKGYSNGDQEVHVAYSDADVADKKWRIHHLEQRKMYGPSR